MTLEQRPIESHEVHSQRLMQHAWEQLDRGDRLQASEKAWGTVAHRLKVIANERGWRYVTHSNAFDIATRLAQEVGDPRLRILFSVANGLHRNNYVDAIPLHELRVEIEMAQELLEMLEQVD